MSIVGIKSAIYGVEDLASATKFYEDFGLPLVSSVNDESTFQVEEGATVVLRKSGDRSVADQWYEGPGVREVIWGVDSADALEELVADLGTDRDLRTDADGTVHFVADDGLPYGLAVFRKHHIVYAPDPVNAPGSIHRLNVNRKWKKRARPKALAHVVFRVPDPGMSFRFFRDRLGFRLSDVSKSLGVFARCDGANDHHNIFWLNTSGGIPGLTDGFDHLCFTVEDIDEVMVGANYMSKQGWDVDHGVGRHRIASAIFYYIDNNPCGGQTEYGADSDYLDDNWVPRLWDPMFGGWAWAQQLPVFMRNADTVWDVGYADVEHPWPTMLADPKDVAEAVEFAEVAGGAPA